MGLFDLFGKKRDANAAELLRVLNEHQVAARAGAVDAGTLPKAHGPFGLCETSPIPTAGIGGSRSYLARLRTANGQTVSTNRIGSTSAPDVTSGAIDIYQVSASGAAGTTLYLSPYHKRNSRKAPEGFLLAQSESGERPVAHSAASPPAISQVTDAPGEGYHFSLPKAHGEFGRVASNPIPLAASQEAVLSYILGLRADDDDVGRQVSAGERPSTACPGVTPHPVRVYDVTPFKVLGKPAIEPSRLYVVSRFAFNTTKVPSGFHFFDPTPNYGGNTLCTRCGAIVETTEICQYDCPRCGQLPVNDDVEHLRFVANLGALSDTYWTGEQLRAIGGLIAGKRELPAEVKELQHLHFSQVISEKSRKRFEIPPLRRLL